MLRLQYELVAGEFIPDAPFVYGFVDLTRLNACVGKTMHGIYYAFGLHDGYDILYDKSGEVDAVDQVVLFDFDEFTLRIDWAMFGDLLGLSLNFGWAVPLHFMVIDATSVSVCSDVIGETVADISVIWDEVDEPFNAVRTLGGVRFSFGSGKQAAIMLGEIDLDGQLKYDPHTLLVARDTVVVDSYIAAGGCSSAWEAVEGAAVDAKC